MQDVISSADVIEVSVERIQPYFNEFDVFVVACIIFLSFAVWFYIKKRRSDKWLREKQLSDLQYLQSLSQLSSDSKQSAKETR